MTLIIYVLIVYLCIWAVIIWNERRKEKINRRIGAVSVYFDTTMSRARRQQPTHVIDWGQESDETVGVPEDESEYIAKWQEG